MPKKAKKAKMLDSQAKLRQKQKQSQNIRININTDKPKPKRTRKKGGGGGGGGPIQAHQHNLNPIVNIPSQPDYTPILLQYLQQQKTQSLVPTQPMASSETPLAQSVQQNSIMTAEQMAGQSAMRRAGPTASNFQPKQNLDMEDAIRSRSSSFASTVSAGNQSVNTADLFDANLQTLVQPSAVEVRPPDPIVTERLVKPDDEMMVGAEAVPKKGRPFKEATEAVPVEGFVSAGIRQSTKELGEAGETLYRTLSSEQKLLQPAEEPMTLKKKPRKKKTPEELALAKQARDLKKASQPSDMTPPMDAPSFV